MNAEPKSKAERRRTEIMRILMDGGSTQIRDLGDRLGVSLMTIHRDLSELAEQGLIRRVRGSVSAEKSLLFESSYLFRARKNLEEKRRLARAAVAHLEPGYAVVWDDSTTTYQMVDFIAQATPITVLTNALPVLSQLHEVADVQLIALGGRYHRGYKAFVGLACEKAIRSYHVDVAVMSTTTVQGLSLYTQDEHIVRVKQAMLEVARKKILLVDESKFHFTALNHVAELTDFDLVLLPEGVDAATVAGLQRSGVKIEMVP